MLTPILPGHCGQKGDLCPHSFKHGCLGTRRLWPAQAVTGTRFCREWPLLAVVSRCAWGAGLLLGFLSSPEPSITLGIWWDFSEGSLRKSEASAVMERCGESGESREEEDGACAVHV